MLELVLVIDDEFVAELVVSLVVFSLVLLVFELLEFALELVLEA